MPVDAEDLAAYLWECSERLAPSTVARRLAAIVDAHRRAGSSSPREAPQVRNALARIEWRHRGRRRPTVPLDVESLSRMSLCLPATTSGARDRAILLVAYGAALRRTDIVGLDLGSATPTRRGRGLRLELQRGVVIVPAAPQAHLCALRAWERWSYRLNGEGPLFRPVDRHGNVGAGRLSDRAVNNVVRRAATRAGLDGDRWSGRSLRLGMVLAAAAAGASDEGIVGHTGHRSVRLVRAYRRAERADTTW